MNEGKLSVSQSVLMEERGYVTPKRAAALAGRHVVTIYEWMLHGKIKWTHVGRRRYIERASLDAYLGPVLGGTP